jgi:hypothetical protein
MIRTNRLIQYMGLAALSAALMGPAKGFDGAIDVGYSVADSNKTASANVSLSKEYGPNLN